MLIPQLLFIFQASIGLVQSAVIGGTASGASQSISFSSTPTVGHTAIVGISDINGGVIISVVDNQGNSYSRMAGQAFSSSHTAPEASIWCAPINTASGTFTITAASQTNGFFSLVIAEYSGASCNGDKNDGATVPSGSPPYSCGSFTTTNANDLIVTVINVNSSTNPVTFSVSAGFTIRQTVTNGSATQPLGYADQIVTSTGTFTPQWTTTTSGNACATAAIQAASGGGGTGGPWAMGFVQ